MLYCYQTIQLELFEDSADKSKRYVWNRDVSTNYRRQYL